MTETNFIEFNKILKKNEKFAPVYLLYGENFLYKSVFKELINLIIPKNKKSFNYERFDGADVNIFKAIEVLNTYSFFSENKVVAITDSHIFHMKENVNLLFDKIKLAFDNNEIQKAAKNLLGLLGIISIKLEDFETDLNKKTIDKSLNLSQDLLTDTAWLKDIINFCKENQLKLSSKSQSTNKDEITALNNAILKGLPSKNHLIITTQVIDKRKTLYKTIKQLGIVVDCSVPKTNRKADKDAQETVISEIARTLLAQNKKKMSKPTCNLLYETTGFDLGVFTNNLKKLISYVGKRQEITTDDIKFILTRTKADPIYELTNAITDKNLNDSLFYLNSLLADNFHPLQMLAAITNQIRKLIAIKSFTTDQIGKLCYSKGMQYNSFKNNVFNPLKEYDEKLIQLLESWKQELKKKPANVKPDVKSGVKKVKKSKKKISTDLLIIKNPNNLYPIYKMFQKSDNFNLDELIKIFDKLNQADILLKSSRLSQKIILENICFYICKTN